MVSGAVGKTKSVVFWLQAVTGHEECVEALLQHSANFVAQDCKGRTPIHLAAACGHIGVLGGLLHAAQSLETLPVLTDSQGYTPLHWACYNGTETRLENSYFWKKKTTNAGKS